MIAVTMTQKGDALVRLRGFPGKMKVAASRASADAMKSVRAEIVRQTTAKYYITAGRLRGAMTLGRTQLKISGARQLLHHYKLTPKTRGKKPKPLMGAVEKSGGLKPLGHAFLMPTGSKVVAAARVGSSRLPIKLLVGPAIPQIAANEETLEAVESKLEETFNKRLEYWAMRQIGAVK